MKLFKNSVLSLIFMVILSFAILSVSASNVDDMLSSSENTFAANHDLGSITSRFEGLNYDDYSTDDVSRENLNETDMDNNNYFSQSDYKDGLGVVQKSNSENDINKVEDLVNVNEIFNSFDYTINQTSENTYILTLGDKTTLTVGVMQIYNFDSFKESVDYISTNTVAFDAIVMDFKENLNLNIDPWNNDLINMNHVKNLIIRGFGATITVNNPHKNDEYHFANVDFDAMLGMSNITINGFNTAIYNHGTCQLDNVIFDNNIVDYISDGDFGGAIRNYGSLKCVDCSFISNYAKYGGAIYNEKGSQSSLIDCYFDINTGYGRENGNVRTNDNNNIYSCKGASCLVFNHNDEIVSLNVDSSLDYNNLQSSVDKLGNVKFLVLNFTCPEISHEIRSLNFKNVENLYIRGNGAKINVLNSKPSDEIHFLQIDQSHFCSIDNLQICGFNTAIINQGSLSISQSTFRNNKINYKVKKDYGGAIYNDEGSISISDSIFEDNYAKHGGAIYNENGIITCTGCIFGFNNVYGNGGAICNNVGLLLCKGCIFTNNFADDNGGSVYNYYALANFLDVFFDNSRANDDGGSIYNDFGEILINNCTFMVSAENQNEIFSYGENAKCSVIGDSHIIENTTDGIVIKDIKVVEDAPSEALRWILRIAEIGLCVALTVVGGFITNAAVAFAIGFFGGALLAGVEELIEGIYLDHKFNIYNCLVMVLIAGILDGAATGLGSFLGKTVFKVGGKLFTKLGASTVKVLNGLATGALDVVAEVITEFLPRFDFSKHDVPNSIIPLPLK